MPSLPQSIYARRREFFRLRRRNVNSLNKEPPGRLVKSSRAGTFPASMAGRNSSRKPASCYFTTAEAVILAVPVVPQSLPAVEGQLPSFFSVAAAFFAEQHDPAVALPA